MAWWQRQHGKTTRGRLVALLRRTELSVEELAARLKLTDNAVRAQLAALEREGVVRATGIRRDGTVGKPATLYGVAPETTSLFSSAYAPTLRAVLAELAERLPPRQVRTILRSAGRRLAPALPPRATLDERARASAAFLAGLGADAELVHAGGGYEIRGFGCPLSDAVSACASTCTVVEELLSEITQEKVEERCDRRGAPRCRFLIGTTE